MSAAPDLAVPSTQITAQTAQQTHLPTELWIEVCNHLPGHDLQNLRLVSNHLRSLATTVLFTTVFLKLHVSSFKKLLAISNDAILSKHVRHIIYDGRQINPYYLQMDRDEWAKRIGSGTPSHSHLKKYYKSLSEDDKEMAYYWFCDYVEGQQYIKRKDHEISLLRAALTAFPALDTVSYHEVRPTSSRRPSEFSIKYLSPIAQKILFEPLPGIGSHHFWNIAEASEGRLSTLIGTGLDIRNWNIRARSWALFSPLPKCYQLSVDTISAVGDDLDEAVDEEVHYEEMRGSSIVSDEGAKHLECLSRLKTLKLEFFKGEINPGSTSVIATLLINATQLQVLRISFENLPWKDRRCVARLPEVIQPSVTWTNLRNLSLQALYTSSDDLRSLMRRHARRLCSLHLTHVDLSRPSRGSELGSSWISFIHFLHDELSLLQVKFDGYLSNLFDEGWQTWNWDAKGVFGDAPLKRYKPNCLRYRIERYVTHQGPSPFRPVVETEQATALRVKRIRKFWANLESDEHISEDEDEEEEVLSEESMHRQIPWRWDADTSWVFEQSLLMQI